MFALPMNNFQNSVTANMQYNKSKFVVPKDKWLVKKKQKQVVVW